LERAYALKTSTTIGISAAITYMSAGFFAHAYMHYVSLHYNSEDVFPEKMTTRATMRLEIYVGAYRSNHQNLRAGTYRSPKKKCVDAIRSETLAKSQSRT